MSTVENGTTQALVSDEPEKLDLRTVDISAEKKADLLELFPEARTEGGKIDFERLKLALGEAVDVGKERYGMNWPGKADCFRTIQTPSVGALRPAPEESVNFDTTENLIIEGDNLEVLKLLQKSYLGKIKMIYIDPPYNTGKDFIYPDNYTESLETYLEYTGQVDAEGKKFGTNTDADGRFHTKWLNMMYARLYLARNLLTEDGVIFISIDDHEDANLEKICNEIFGEENYLAQLVWRTDGNFDNQAKFKNCHEYVLVYAKHAESFPNPPVIDPSTPKESKLFKEEIRNTIVKNGPKNPVSEVVLPAGFPCDFTSGDIGPRSDSWPHYTSVARVRDGKLANDVEVKSGWSSKELLLEFIAKQFQPIVDAKGQETRFVVSSSGAIEAIKIRSDQSSHVITVLTGFGGSQKATAEIAELGIPFDDYPKPTDLIEYFVKMNVGDDFIVCDFFAGSGTTGHAVLNLNREDGGSRKFILVQLPEPCAPDSAAFKAEYKTIADITKDRVRKASKKLADAGKKESEDLGFRVFKLADSNFTAWNAAGAKDAAALATQLDLHVDHIRQQRSDDDILYELLLKSGFPLTTPVEKKAVEGKTIYSVASGALVICLDRALTLELVRAIAEMKPERIVCLDEGFAGNDQLKTNAVQTFKTKGITSFKTV